MAISIKHPEADRLVRELAALMDESLTDAIINALRDRLTRERGRVRGRSLRDEIRAIRKRTAALPVRDDRSADQILGYDEGGLPR